MPELATLIIIGFVAYFFSKAVIKAFSGIGNVIVILVLLFAYWVLKNN